MQPPTPYDPSRPRLTRTQVTRLALAQRDLDAARAADLAAADLPGLVLLVERLRGSLDDAIRLVDQLAA